jgi:glycosyltransferase involved in cell wall biosynthesis
MACGTPCVVTDVGDSAHLVGDSGWIVRANDVNQLAAGLASAIARPRPELSELGGLARARIQQNFQIAQNAARYADLYTHLQQRIT